MLRFFHYCVHYICIPFKVDVRPIIDYFVVSYIIQPINNINHIEDTRKVSTCRVIKACNLSKNDYLDRCRFSKLEALEIRNLRLSLLLFIQSFINHNYYSVSESDSFVYFLID